MKTREIWKVVVLGIITLGIYDLYWLYLTYKELRTKGNKIPPFSLLLLPGILLFLVLVLQFGLRSTVADSTDVNSFSTPSPAHRISNLVSVLIGLFSVLFGLVYSLVWFYRYSQAVERVTRGKLSTGVCFVLAIFLNGSYLGFIWPAIVQNAFNNA